MKAQWLALAVCVAATALAEPVRNIRVVNDRAPDCSTLETLVASVTRECKSDDEKAIAIYNVCRYFYYHHPYPSEEGGIGALKMIHVYGWSLCGGQHTVLAALWEKAGFNWRYRGWQGHTTVEAFYGGRWHYLDTFLKFYCWRPEPQAPGGRTIASQDDIKAMPALVTDGFHMDQERKVCYHKDNRFEYLGGKVNWTAPAFMVCGDGLDGVVRGCSGPRSSSSPRGWATIKFDDPDYSTAVNLGVGYALTLDWDKVEGAHYCRGVKTAPHHSCGDKDYRNCPVIGPILEPYLAKSRARTYSNGTLVFKPDLRNDAFLASLQEADNVAWQAGSLRPKDAARPGRFVVEMATPYVVVGASVQIACDDASAEVSDDGKSWGPVDPAKLAERLTGRYRYHIRVSFRKPITGIELTSIVQHNQEALPYLAPGKNTVTIAAENPKALGTNRLVVTAAYCLGSRNRTPEEIFDRGAEIARAHYAEWSEKPIVVQKAVEQFPCTLEIPVPTPKGRQPVYPRMLFLRREVLAPGQEPMATPAPPSTPAVGQGEVLATLPEPWVLGVQPPGSRADLPTRTTTVPLPRVAYCTMKGEVFKHQFVKWLKDNSDAWILLVGVDGVKLPEADKLASAKLAFYVWESHEKADMQVAAVSLDAPFVAGKPYDFKGLGKIISWTTVKKGKGRDAPFEPPQRYEIDVTREVRAWAKGQKPLGFALRVVPNRGIDEGWTVRFTPSKDKLPELEISTYRE